jgi:nicotinamide phosphoribosyltransferase
MKLKALSAIDFYKADHRPQYPVGTELVYSNFTPRSMRLYKGHSKKIVVFGLQGFCKWFLIDMWNETFFNRPKEEVVKEYKKRMDTSLGPNAVSMEHIEALHDLGYLPLHIKGLPEGSVISEKIAMITVYNTIPQFFWLVNYIESVMSSELWKPSTVATIAKDYKEILTRYANATGADLAGVDLQCHDFSFRGMSGLHDSASAGSGHLLSFIGTDGVPSIDYLEEYYNIDSEKEMIGCSIPATEHSVMCMNGQAGEQETFRRLIEDLYPTGIVAIVSDTWDFWKVITQYIPNLKDKIMARQPNALGLNKVVLRPDSGDPVKIITGYTGDEYYIQEDGENISYADGTTLSHAEVKGAVECLWDTFGGTETAKGYKELDEHIGLIYGDSITLERAEAIMSRLMAKGFASSNCVLGIGSYTYQYNTRDSMGFAMKATYGIVNGEMREIFKDPVTDSGVKKSAKGLLRVDYIDGNYVMEDQVSWDEEAKGALVTVFKDGKMYNECSLTEIRERLAAS